MVEESTHRKPVTQITVVEPEEGRLEEALSVKAHQSPEFRDKWDQFGNITDEIAPIYTKLRRSLRRRTLVTEMDDWGRCNGAEAWPTPKRRVSTMAPNRSRA